MVFSKLLKNCFLKMSNKLEKICFLALRKHFYSNKKLKFFQKRKLSSLKKFSFSSLKNHKLFSQRKKILIVLLLK